MGWWLPPRANALKELTQVPDIGVAVYRLLHGGREIAPQQGAQQLIDYQDRFGQIIHRLPLSPTHILTRMLRRSGLP